MVEVEFAGRGRGGSGFLGAGFVAGWLDGFGGEGLLFLAEEGVLFGFLTGGLELFGFCFFSDTRFLLARSTFREQEYSGMA